MIRVYSPSVLYCTLLAKAETAKAKSDLEEEMIADPVKAAILKVSNIL